jgi:hypothetical protein
MNAHINVDMPQALLRVISPEEFKDAELIASRRRDHCRIDDILASRIGSEEAELEKAGGRRTWLDRAMMPINHRASRRFLKEARRHVWANAGRLHLARDEGDACLKRRVADLEVAGCQRVQELMRPGAVLMRLAVHGFGVDLPADPPPPWD